MPENNYRHIGSFLEKEKKTGAARGKNYLFVIAIDEYMHCPKLFNAVRDAKTFIEILTTKYNFDPKHLITLFNEQATEENIDKAFRELAEIITPEDNLIIYFSGHGEFEKQRQRGYWVPVDAHPGAFHEYISNTEIRDNLDAIQSKHTFLIADSCFSGSLFATYRNASPTDRLEKDPSRWGLTAGRSELVLDGKPGTNSPFADSLLYQLKNATKPLGVAELCNKVIETVITSANQTPRGEPLRVKGHKGGQFVFHPRQDEKEVWKAACQKNTAGAFEEYLALFPNGKYVREATQNIHALAEESVWENAQKTQTTQAYLNYIRQYKGGKYYTAAIEKLAELEEDAFWKDVQLKNTLSAFLEYTVKYPNGKHIEAAQKRIAEIEQAQSREAELAKEKQKWAEQKRQLESDRKNQQGLFNVTVEQAENLFRQARYGEARDAFAESIALFQPGFAPDPDYLQKRMEDCIQKAKFEQLFESGKKAFQKKNYALALQYFQKAYDLEKNAKINDWIKNCRQKIAATQPRRTRAKQTAAQVPPPQKKSNTTLKWIVGIFVAIVFVVAIIDNMDTSSDFPANGVPYTPVEPSDQLPPLEDVSKSGTAD
ncbi:MAG: hypothetical protein D6714_21570, partial [Bacteroidetes bacterium]